MDADLLHLLAQTAPTPLAQLAGRAQNESVPERQHHSSYYIFELWLRMVAAVTVAQYRERGQRVAAIDEQLPTLVQPAAGTALAFVRLYAKHFRDSPLGAFFALPLTNNMKAGYRWAGEHGGVDMKATPNCADFSQALVSYRNKIIGHGALQKRAFYREGAEQLFVSIGTLVNLASEALPGRYVSAEEITDDESGGSVALLFDLIGSLRTRRADALRNIQAKELHQGAVFFEDASRCVVALFPWLIWHEDFVDVMSGASKTRLEYLNYSTGEVLRREAPHVAALRAFLAVSSVALPDGHEQRQRPGHWMGSYELLSVLGRGGMGTVYEARQESTSMPVALKLLPGEFSRDGAALARFSREVNILKRCAHRNIVSVLDAGDADGKHYFVMELIRGCSLAELYGELANVPRDARPRLTSSHLQSTLRRLVRDRTSAALSGPIAVEARGEMISDRTVATAMDIVSEAGEGGEELWRLLLLRFAEVAEALAHLHDRGVIHRDVKPANIMLTEDGSRAVVMDLGVAKTASGSVHTKTGSFVGTLRYASREQAIRSLELTYRSDLYSLGATMYELFTLTPLYAENESEASSTPDGALLKQILDDRPAVAQTRNSALKPEVSIILEKLLEKQPERRFYASAAVLAEDLRNVYHQRPISARDYTADERDAFALYDLLQAQAAAWTTGKRARDLLWGEGRAGEMLRLQLRATFELSSIQSEFYNATIAHAAELSLARETKEADDRAAQESLRLERAEAALARRRVRRALVASAFLVLVVFSVILSISYVRVHRERDISRAREEEVRGARDRLLTAEANGYLVKARQAVRDQHWDEAILYAAYARERHATTAAGSDTVGDVFALEASVPIAPRLRWSKRFDTGARDVSLSPDGQWIAVATDRTSLVIASAVDGSLVKRLPLDTGGAESAHASAVAFSEQHDLAAALDDGTVAVWDATDWTSRPALRTTSRSAVGSVAFSLDGRLLAVGGDDGVLRLWRMPAGVLMHAEAPTRGADATQISAVAVSPDGRLVSAGYDNGAVRILRRDEASWATAQVIQAHPGKTTALTFAGGSVLSASDDDSMAVWELDPAGRLPSGPRRLKEFGADVYSLASARDSNLIVSGGADNAVRFWRPGTWGQMRVIARYPEEVLSVAVSRDGATVAVALEDGTIEVRDIVDRDRARAAGERSPLMGHNGGVEAVVFSDDGAELLSSGQDTDIRIWRLGEGRIDGILPGSSVRWGLDASRDLRTAVTGDRSGELRLWDVPSRRSVQTRATLGVEVLTVALSPDERLIAFGTSTGVTGLWRREDDALYVWKAHRDTTNAVQFSRDGKWLASAGADPSVRLWDVAERLSRPPSGSSQFDEAGHTLPGVDGRTDDVTFSADGTRVAAASRDGIVRVWDARTRSLLHSYTGHTDRAYGVAFSPDGRTLASCSKDGSIRLIDLSTQKELVLLGHVGAVNTVRFARSGARLASAGLDRTIRLWDMSTHAEVGTVRPSLADERSDVVEARTGLCLVAGEATYRRDRCPPSSASAAER